SRVIFPPLAQLFLFFLYFSGYFSPRLHNFFRFFLFLGLFLLYPAQLFSVLHISRVISHLHRYEWYIKNKPPCAVSAHHLFLKAPAGAVGIPEFMPLLTQRRNFHSTTHSISNSAVNV
ncbi:MAG: hypothetical protein LUC83_00965, partial [Clostridiales bacterium]|nr:hypothetical protein [Clostridiales bacterium]